MNHNNHDQIYLAKLYHYLKRKRAPSPFLCKTSEFQTIIKLKFSESPTKFEKTSNLIRLFFSNLLALSEHINFTNTHKNYQKLSKTFLGDTQLPDELQQSEFMKKLPIFTHFTSVQINPNENFIWGIHSVSRTAGRFQFENIATNST